MMIELRCPFCQTRHLARVLSSLKKKESDVMMTYEVVVVADSLTLTIVAT